MHRNEKHIELTESERITLQEGSNHHPKSEFRKKCHGLLLNHTGLSYTKVALYLEVNNNTLTNWVKAWETNGITGLSRKSGQGRQPILNMTTTAHTQVLHRAVEKHCQDVKLIQAELTRELRTPMSTDTVKRFLKKTIIRGVASAVVPTKGKTRQPTSKDMSAGNFC